MVMVEQKSPLSHHEKKRQAIAKLLIVVGIALAVIAILLLVYNHHVEPQPPAGALQSSNAPSSKRPSQSAIDNYTVAPDLPKYISVPAINVSRTRVLQLGLLKNGQIAVPDNIYDTGWYNDSAKPGQAGAMFIYGHVSSWTANGVFYNLNKLKPGDKIVITRGNNKTFTYQVASTKVYPYNEVNMRQVLAPANAGKPGLNLMTCTGQVINGTSEFNERLVVFTSLVSP